MIRVVLLLTVVLTRLVRVVFCAVVRSVREDRLLMALLMPFRISVLAARVLLVAVLVLLRALVAVLRNSSACEELTLLALLPLSKVLRLLTRVVVLLSTVLTSPALFTSRLFTALLTLEALLFTSFTVVLPPPVLPVEAVTTLKRPVTV